MATNLPQMSVAPRSTPLPPPAQTPQTKSNLDRLKAFGAALRAGGAAALRSPIELFSEIAKYPKGFVNDVVLPTANRINAGADAAVRAPRELTSTMGGQVRKAGEFLLPETTARIKAIPQSSNPFLEGAKLPFAAANELIVRPAARVTTGLALDVAQPFTRKDLSEFTPRSAAGRAIFGDEPVLSRAKQTEQNLALGKNLTGSGIAGVPIAMALGSLDALAFEFGLGGKAEKLANQGAKQLIRQAEENLGRRLVKEEADDIIRHVGQMAKNDGVEAFEKRLKNQSLSLPERFSSQAAAPTLPAVASRAESAVPAQMSRVADNVASQLPPPAAPVQTVLPNASKETVGNIRLDKFAVDREAKDELARVINENQGFMEQRRGTRSWEQTNEAAAQITKDLTKTKAGKALNAEELTALGQTTAGLSKKVQGILEEIAAPGGDSTLNKLRLAQAREELTFATASLSGARAEAGRSLQILRQLNKAIQSGDSKLINEARKMLGPSDWGESSEYIAKKLADLGDDEVAKYKFVQSLQKQHWTGKVTDFVDWYFYNNILSGPATHIRNTFANAGKVAFNATSVPFAAAADAVKTGVSKLTGGSREREVVLSELPQHLKGLWAGMKDGWDKASFVFNNGFSQADVASSSFRPAEVFKGRLPNVVSRSLQASDQFFRTVAERAEVYANAWRTALSEGKTGNAIAERAAELVENPTSKMLEQARRTGAETVFQQNGDKLSQALGKLKSNITITRKDGTQYKLWNPLKLVIPFVQTPYNVVKAGLEASGGGLITGALKETGREASQAQGRALAGMTILTPLAFMAAEGKISGNGPTNPAERDALYAQGWQPNSVRIGDKWYSYQTTPLAIPLSLIGGAADKWTYEGEMPSVGEIAAKAGNTLLNQSFLSGLSSLQKAVADPERYGQAFTEGLALGFIPASSALGQVARATDTTIRQPEGVKEKIMANIPGLSTKLPARRTVFGEESTRPGGFLNQFNPLKASEIKPDATYGALEEAGLVAGFPSQSIDKRKMDKAEYSEFLRVSGRIKKNILDDLTAKPEFQALDSEAKKKAVDKVTEQANKYARDQFRPALELRYLGIPSDNLTPVAKEAINRLVTKSEYKKLSDEERKQVMERLLPKLQSLPTENTPQ